MSVYEVHLGSWRRGDGNRWLTYDELADALVPYVAEHGLHARRADAGQRASAGRVVGLPADRALRADLPLRRTRGVRAVRRPVPRRRAGRHTRLGACAFSGRPARTRAFRRHRALRARRSAPRLPSGLEHRDLQFRAQGGRQLPARERALLARPLPRRRPARRRRRLDALSRLFAQGGRVAAEPAWAATRTSRRSPSCAR